MIYTGNILIWSCSLCGLLVAGAAADETLFKFDQNFEISKVKATDAEVSLSSEDGGALRVDTGHDADWPGITLEAPEGHWDLSEYGYLALDVRNVGPKHMGVFWRIDNPGANGIINCITRKAALAPGEKKTIRFFLQRKLPADIAAKLFGMRGYPGGLSKKEGLDASIISQLLIFVHKPTIDYSFEVSNIRAGGSYVSHDWLSMDESEFFPMIDKYGQFIHNDWPGKIKSPDDLTQHKEEEAADLSAHPVPDGWNGYGGWESGPKLASTGYFRVEKHKGKWWLVDPDGRLFWSHGIDCVHTSNGTTPITDREYLYRDLPDKSSPFAKFYGKGSWAPHNYYEDKGVYETYNFTGANLLRKYGEDWYKESADMAHRRLRSWGMNTIANWSSNDIFLMRKTPYVVSIGFGGRKLEGSQGYWGKFRDVFDPSFKEELRKSMAWQKDKSAGDPWCIGYFVDNEIAWGDELSLAVAALTSPADQPAKRVFIDDLKAKYETIGNLNQAWDSQYASWDDLLGQREEPDKKKAYDDLADFYTKSAEMYFKTCRDAVKEIAPNSLYLGCRFSSVNDRAVAASAKYCDVISYNFYRPEVKSVRLPNGIDMPVIIGEFHFGALDRGMFHTGLGPVENQAERAKAYETYVSGALENPWIVGTHWFQYGDQATTGRGDGENYQIGFLDVVDTPYVETIKACREVGYSMYEKRLTD